ncbi:hypothetical protein CUPS4256_09410, partial [Campylobacter upsaliensis]|uniref:hypothetical protein n=1 Tax=Campylobacter upsaliensis TaxID=28080 RepID=UPI002149EBD8
PPLCFTPPLTSRRQSPPLSRTKGLKISLAFFVKLSHLSKTHLSDRTQGRFNSRFSPPPSLCPA